MRTHLQSCVLVKVVQIGLEQLKEERRKVLPRTLNTVRKPQSDPWSSPVLDAKDVRPGPRDPGPVQSPKAPAQASAKPSKPAETNPLSKEQEPAAPVVPVTPVQPNCPVATSPAQSQTPAVSSPNAEQAAAPKQFQVERGHQTPTQQGQEKVGSSTDKPKLVPKEAFTLPGGFAAFDASLSRSQSSASTYHDFSPRASQATFAGDMNNPIANRREGYTAMEAGVRSQPQEMPGFTQEGGKTYDAPPARAPPGSPVIPDGAGPPPPYTTGGGGEEGIVSSRSSSKNIAQPAAAAATVDARPDVQAWDPAQQYHQRVLSPPVPSGPVPTAIDARAYTHHPGASNPTPVMAQPQQQQHHYHTGNNTRTSSDSVDASKVKELLALGMSTAEAEDKLSQANGDVHAAASLHFFGQRSSSAIDPPGVANSIATAAAATSTTVGFLGSGVGGVGDGGYSAPGPAPAPPRVPVPASVSVSASATQPRLRLSMDEGTFPASAAKVVFPPVKEKRSSRFRS